MDGKWRLEKLFKILDKSKLKTFVVSVLAKV